MAYKASELKSESSSNETIVHNGMLEKERKKRGHLLPECEEKAFKFGDRTSRLTIRGNKKTRHCH